jgi:hypothetical protein
MTPIVAVGMTSAFIALCSLLLALRVDRRSNSKRIAWRILSNATALPQGQTTHWPNVEVWHDGARVDDPRFITIEIKNVGSVGLREADIEKSPPRVTVSDGGIVTAEVAKVLSDKTSVRKLEAVTVADTYVECKVDLLNAGDSLVFELLVSGGHTQPVVTVEAADFKVRRLPTPGSAEESTTSLKFDSPGVVFTIAFCVAVAILIVVFLSFQSR